MSARIPVPSPDQSAPVLLVSPCSDDHVVLPEILSHTNWEWHKTETCQQASELLIDHVVAVLICERDQPDGCWQDLLQRCTRVAAPPNLIVCSRLADEYLWAEVLNLGGYDVLIKPFDYEEVSRVIFNAWNSWMRLGQRAAMSKPIEAATSLVAMRTAVA